MDARRRLSSPTLSGCAQELLGNPDQDYPVLFRQLRKNAQQCGFNFCVLARDLIGWQKVGQFYVKCPRDAFHPSQGQSPMTVFQFLDLCLGGACTLRQLGEGQPSFMPESGDPVLHAAPELCADRHPAIGLAASDDIKR